MAYYAELNSPASDPTMAAHADESVYRQRLNRWAIAHMLIGKHPKIVARFRSRADADGHLRFLCQRSPHSTFVIIPDPQESLREEA